MNFFRRAIEISAPTIEQTGSGTRVTALVNGSPLWFESDDIELTPSPEAFASALLLSSQHRGRRLVIQPPVDITWKTGIEGVIAKWSEWWGYQPLSPEADTILPKPAVIEGMALAFSGGVDSFFSLQTGPRPDFLVTVHGFDIPLGDTRRMAALERTLREAEETTGAKSVVIRTNLRDHPANGRRYLWERSHGGALAAIGHLLGNSVRQFFISSTYSIYANKDWGSSVHTDPLFSSSKVEIVHFGTDPREEKIRGILPHPMVRKHLRVCWENRKPEGNCSRCAKCLLVMLHLAEYGVLDEFDVFEGGDELAQRLDAVRYTHTHILVMQRAVDRGQLAPNLSAATTRLMQRSLAAKPWFDRKKRLRNWVDRYV